VAAQPIEFGALDGAPVDVFFLIVSPPEQSGPHIKALAQISRMMSSDTLREELAQADSPAKVLELFRREEALLGE
jgi:mannitol/fructose-specific phosphotransferase system IIA component (Ntr-type)